MRPRLRCAMVAVVIALATIPAAAQDVTPVTPAKLTCKWAVPGKCVCKVGLRWQGMPRRFCR